MAIILLISLWLGLDSSVIGGLTSTFGEGEGNALYNFLAHGAGYNPNVGNALIAQMQPNIERGMANLQEMYGSTGNYGSPSALAEGDYMSQATLGENSILANLYNDAVNRYYGVISGAMPYASGAASNQGGVLGSLGGILGSIPGIGSAVQGLGPLLSGIFGSGGSGAIGQTATQLGLMLAGA